MHLYTYVYYILYRNAHTNKYSIYTDISIMWRDILIQRFFDLDKNVY